jgi:hypothetical protein
MVAGARSSKFAGVTFPHSDVLEVPAVLLQRINTVSATEFLTDPALLPDLTNMDGMYARARSYLEGLQARLRRKGIRVHAHVLLGPVVQTIVGLSTWEKAEAAGTVVGILPWMKGAALGEP